MLSTIGQVNCALNTHGTSKCDVKICDLVMSRAKLLLSLHQQKSLKQ